MAIRLIESWYGGKYKLLPLILALLPRGYTTWVEAFAGSCVISLNRVKTTPNDVEIINDMNEKFMDMIRLLKDKNTGQAIIKELSTSCYDAYTFKIAKVNIEDVDGGEDDEFQVDRAIWIYIIYSQSFNNVGKTFSRANTQERYRDFIRSNLPKVHERLQGVQVMSVDGIDLIQKHADNPKAFLMLDPPYLHTTRAKGAKNTYAHEMSEADHIKMLEVLKDCKAGVMLCGYYSELYDQYLIDGSGKWNRYLLAETFKSAASGNKPRPRAKEWIWVNYELPTLAGRYIDLGTRNIKAK